MPFTSNVIPVTANPAGINMEVTLSCAVRGNGDAWSAKAGMKKRAKHFFLAFYKRDGGSQTSPSRGGSRAGHIHTVVPFPSGPRSVKKTYHGAASEVDIPLGRLKGLREGV